jgi:hypothetical protein
LVRFGRSETRRSDGRSECNETGEEKTGSEGYPAADECGIVEFSLTGTWGIPPCVVAAYHRFGARKTGTSSRLGTWEDCPESFAALCYNVCSG